MVLDDEFELEHHAMLQNKASIQHNVIAKRKEQLKNWEASEMNKLASSRRPVHQSRVKFQDSDIFLSACVSGDEEEVEDLLDKGANIDVATIDGVTALHQAVIDDNLDIVKFLVEHKADINAQDNEGWTPLHAAVCCGSLPIAKYLCNQGADMTLTNSDKELALDLAEENELRNYLQEQICLKQVDVEKCREREFSLMMNDCTEWIRSGRYLDHPHPRTGATALHVAASKGYNQLIGMLIRAGADVNMQDKEGWQPLHAAAHWAEKDACRILMENGASLTATTHSGQSVLMVADKSIIEYLENLQQKLDELRNDAIEQQQQKLQEQRLRETSVKVLPKSASSDSSSSLTTNATISQSNGLPKDKESFNTVTGTTLISISTPKSTAQAAVAVTSTVKLPSIPRAMPPPASTTAHRQAVKAPPLAEPELNDTMMDEEEEENDEDEENSVETVSTASKSSSLSTGSTVNATQTIKEPDRRPSTTSIVSYEETSCSCEASSGSTTGSNFSSMEASSRSMTPKEASSSLYSSDQNVECTVRVPPKHQAPFSKQPYPGPAASPKATTAPLGLYQSNFQKSRQQFTNPTNPSPTASPTTPTGQRIGFSITSAHSTPTRNVFIPARNNYNELLFGREESVKSSAPLARITSPSASDSTVNSSSQSPSPSPAMMGQRKNSLEPVCSVLRSPSSSSSTCSVPWIAQLKSSSFSSSTSTPTSVVGRSVLALNTQQQTSTSSSNKPSSPGEEAAGGKPTEGFLKATIATLAKVSAKPFNNETRLVVNGTKQPAVCNTPSIVKTTISMINSSAQTPPTQPTSQKESESERRLNSKKVRNSRRSTQGVTLEQVEEAARQASTSASSASSSTEDFGRWKSSALTQHSPTEDQKQEDNWKVQTFLPNETIKATKSREVEERGVSKWRAMTEDNLEPKVKTNTSAPYYFKLPAGSGKEEGSLGSSSSTAASSTSLSTSTASQPATFLRLSPASTIPQPTLPSATPSAAKLNRRSQIIRSNRRGTGPVDMEAITAATSTHSMVIEGREEENEEVAENRLNKLNARVDINNQKSKLNVTDSSNHQKNGIETRSLLKTNSSYEKKEDAAENLRYKTLYDRQREENERLNTEIDKLNSKLAKQEALSNGNASNGRLVTPLDDQERRNYERRISALEYELEKTKQLQSDNEKLKDENMALIRVLKKLSK